MGKAPDQKDRSILLSLGDAKSDASKSMISYGLKWVLAVRIRLHEKPISVPYADSVRDIFSADEEERAFIHALVHPAAPTSAGASGGAKNFEELPKDRQAEVQREQVVAALRKHEGVATRAAEELGIWHQRLHEACRRLGIDPKAHREGAQS